MPDETTMTVEGVQVDPLTGDPLSAPADEKPRVIETYLVVDDRGKPVQAIQYDGVADFDPGDGLRLERAEDWKGAAYEPPVDETTTKAQKRVERLNKSLEQVRADNAAIGSDTTAAQVRNMVKRLQRGFIRQALVTLDQIDDTDTDDA